MRIIYKNYVLNHSLEVHSNLNRTHFRNIPSPNLSLLIRPSNMNCFYLSWYLLSKISYRYYFSLLKCHSGHKKGWQGIKLLNKHSMLFFLNARCAAAECASKCIFFLLRSRSFHVLRRQTVCDDVSWTAPARYYKFETERNQTH